MAVEPAMREAGIRHQRGDADRSDALAAKASRRDFQNLLASGVLVTLGVAHAQTSTPIVNLHCWDRRVPHQEGQRGRGYDASNARPDRSLADRQPHEFGCSWFLL